MGKKCTSRNFITVATAINCTPISCHRGLPAIFKTSLQQIPVSPQAAVGEMKSSRERSLPESGLSGDQWACKSGSPPLLHPPQDCGSPSRQWEDRILSRQLPTGPILPRSQCTSASVWEGRSSLGQLSALFFVCFRQLTLWVPPLVPSLPLYALPTSAFLSCLLLSIC